MKNVLFLFLFLMGCSVQAQSAANRFSKEESSDEVSVEENPKGGFTAMADTGGLGNPTGEDDAPPAPIDDYLPLLVITAVGIIIYTTQKKRNLLA